MTRSRIVLVVLVLLAVGAAGSYLLQNRDARTGARFTPQPGTSRADLMTTVEGARRHLASTPHDARASASLANALLRLARVESDPNHAIEAESVLKQVLDDDPNEYTALQMLGAVYLSQHRFRNAIEVAVNAQKVRPNDAWIEGVLGDAHLELGEYDQAFDAFDRMARLRPDAAAYARVAYAHELQGQLEEALMNMQRAAEATSAHDPESLAWHYAQLGHLHLELGQLDAARREYSRAEFTFPGHPYARLGLAQVDAASGNIDAALGRYRDLLEKGPTPELAATVGDLLAVKGDHGGAAAMYARAEKLERDGWATEQAQPGALARMLAERGLKTSDAVALAERAAAERSDVNTMDALAIAYLRAGRLDDAAAAATRALRTGSRNRHVLYHAAAIAHARGRAGEARSLLARVPPGAAADPLLNVAVAQLSLEVGTPLNARR